MSTDFAQADLDALAAFDTPTICNALERLDPQDAGRRLHDRAVPVRISGAEAGRRLRPHGGDPLGAAAAAAGRGCSARCRTTTTATSMPARARRSSSSRISTARRRATARSGARCSRRCTSAWARAASITNGSVRDLDQWAPGFQFLAARVAPSHAYAKPVAFGTRGDGVRHARATGDLVHADRHGAVVVPAALARDVPAAARAVADREARILAVARAPGCTAEKLIAVFAELDDHSLSG